MKCDKTMCIANIKGECVVDECRGSWSVLHRGLSTNKELAKKIYMIICDSFEKEVQNG